MLRVCLPHKLESSGLHINTKLDKSCIFIKIELPQLEDASLCFRGIRLKSFFFKKTRPFAQFSHLLVAKLRSWPLSSMAAINRKTV